MLATRYVSTDKFWGYMCSPSFRRVDLHTGECRGRTIKTAVAPEEIEGFIESKIDEVFRIVSQPFPTDLSVLFSVGVIVVGIMGLVICLLLRA